MDVLEEVWRAKLAGPGRFQYKRRHSAHLWKGVWWTDQRQFPEDTPGCQSDKTLSGLDIIARATAQMDSS